MNLLTSVLWIFCLKLKMIDGSSVRDTEFVKDFTRYMKKNLKFNSVTVIHNFAEESPSAIAQLILQSILMDFPTIAINANAFSTASNNTAINNTLTLSKSKLLLGLSERISSKIIFVENFDESNVKLILLKYLTFLIALAPRTVRPKCIFLLLNSSGEKLRLQTFFEEAWKKNFLNVVIFELMSEKITNVSETASFSNRFQVFVHRYNPFSSAYTKEIFSNKSKMFIDHFTNLNGYSLKVGLFIDVPGVMINKNHTDGDVLSMLEGPDVVLTKALAQTLNFAINVVLVESENPALRGFNVSNANVLEALDNGKIDFSVNLYGIIGNTPLANLSMEVSHLLVPLRNHVIVRQYESSRHYIFYYLAILGVAINIAILSVALAIWLLNLKSKIWTTYNITRLLIGISARPEPVKSYERIIFLCLLFMSCSFSVRLLEMIQNYLWHESFMEFNTLKDLLDSGISPSITMDTKKLNIYDNAVLGQLLNKSTTLSSQEKVLECLTSLISEKSRAQGCEVDQTLGRLISATFSRNEKGWIISFVQEPLFTTAWGTMVSAKTTPYAHGFNRALRSFFQSGLTNYWHAQSFRNFTRIYKSHLHGQRLPQFLPSSKSDEYRQRMLDRALKVPVFKKVLVVCVLGLLVSSIVFFAELMFAHIKCHRRFINRFG